MGFLINIHSMEKCRKTHQMGKAWKISSHTFSIVWVLFSIRFSICSIPHQVGKAWVFPAISHSTRKYNKTHRIGRTWEIGTHTFPIVWVLFSIRFPSYGILHHMGNAWVSPSISHSIGKCSEIHQIGRACVIGTNTLPKM